jgi:BA14K-like protein
MTHTVRTFAAALLCAASLAALPGQASALPFGHALAIKNAAPAAVETVQWRGWGWGVGAGFVAGAIIGGALANPYYGYGPYYGPGYYGGPYYAPPPPVVYGAPGPAVYGAPGPAAVAGDAGAYCAQRYRSYDPRSGTYLGYDGVRHPCP